MIYEYEKGLAYNAGTGPRQPGITVNGVPVVYFKDPILGYNSNTTSAAPVKSHDNNINLAGYGNISFGNTLGSISGVTLPGIDTNPVMNIPTTATWTISVPRSVLNVAGPTPITDLSATNPLIIAGLRQAVDAIPEEDLRAALAIAGKVSTCLKFLCGQIYADEASRQMNDTIVLMGVGIAKAQKVLLNTVNTLKERRQWNMLKQVSDALNITELKNNLASLDPSKFDLKKQVQLITSQIDPQAFQNPTDADAIRRLFDEGIGNSCQSAINTFDNLTNVFATLNTNNSLDPTALRMSLDLTMLQRYADALRGLLSQLDLNLDLTICSFSASEVLGTSRIAKITAPITKYTGDIAI